MTLVRRVSLSAAMLAGTFAALIAAPSMISAQEATPGATPAGCAVTTPDENVTLVTNYISSYDAADAAGIDQALADDYVDNQNRGTQPNDPTSNADEITLAQDLEANFPNSTYTINDIAPLGNDRVVVDVTITFPEVSGATGTSGSVVLSKAIQVNAISVVKIECGEIVSARTVSDDLSLILGLGYTLTPPTAEATPEASPAP